MPLLAAVAQFRQRLLVNAVRLSLQKPPNALLLVFCHSLTFLPRRPSFFQNRSKCSRRLESHRLQPLQSGRGVAGAGFGIQLGGNRDAEANIFRRLSKHFVYDASRQAP